MAIEILQSRWRLDSFRMTWGLLFFAAWVDR